MTETRSAPKIVETVLFPETTWQGISAGIARAFRMTDAEEEALRSNRIARLIAAIPFIAACDDAGKTAVAHLGTFLLSTKETKPWFDATARDSASIMERLWLGAGFKGGDPKIIERGMCLLALNMVCDYERDIAEDAALGKYNPIATGDFDYRTTVEELEWKIVNVSCPEMDEIASIGQMPMSWWVSGGPW